MTPASVSLAMKQARLCPRTGLSIPECCCARCTRRLLRRYAPQLLRPTAKQGGSR